MKLDSDTDGRGDAEEHIQSPRTDSPEPRVLGSNYAAPFVESRIEHDEDTTMQDAGDRSHNGPNSDGESEVSIADMDDYDAT